MNDARPPIEVLSHQDGPRLSPDAATCLQIATSAKIYPGVQLGRDVIIEEFCIIGYPPQGCEPGILPTIIGDGTHIRSQTTIYAGVKMGRRCKIAHGVFIRENTTLGDDTSVGMNVIIEHSCHVGNNVRIQGQAGLAEHTIVEDGAWIGPRVVTTNVLHPTCGRAKDCLQGPIIRRGAILAANVVVGPGIEVGEHAFVGAGSVVAKSVDPGVSMFGVPARKVGTIANTTCPYDMIGGGSPYATKVKSLADGVAATTTPAPTVSPPPLPLVDLNAQHQRHKQELRLAMDRVIFNTRFIMGQEVQEFETAFANFCDVRHVVGVSSGSDALELALAGLGIGQGDEVLVPSHTFIATAAAVVNCGAVPVFVDIEPATMTMNPEDVRRKLSKATKAIVPVHIYGHPAMMDEISEIAHMHGLKLIQDAAQAHGAEAGGHPIGAYGDVVCYSFFPGKNLGAYGDAGAIATNDPVLAERVAKLRNHGRSSKYISDIVGRNARLDTLQAAILGVKLRHLPSYIEGRQRVAAAYQSGMGDLPLELPTARPDCKHVFHLYVLRTTKRDELARHLAHAGIATGIHYPVPLHLQPALKRFGHADNRLPVTERVAHEILSLPIYPEMSDAQIDRVIGSVRQFFAG